MKWERLGLLITIFILIFSLVNAENGNIETYTPNQVIQLSVHLVNTTGEVDGANCSAQIRNSSYDTISTIQLEGRSGGYYNATYTTTRIGNYFCNYNCTFGTSYSSESCDFIIRGDNTMPIAIVLILLFVIIFYIYMSRFMTMQWFSTNGMLKLIFFLSALWMVLIPINFGVFLSETYIGNSGITATINLVYMIVVWINVFITFYFFLKVLIVIIKRLMMAVRG